MPGGYFFAIAFFALIIFAAISSSISILEGPVEALITRFRVSRRKATLGVGLAGFLCAAPLSVTADLWSLAVRIFYTHGGPISALLASLAFFWFFGISRAREEINKGATILLGKWWQPLAKYIFVGLTLIVIIIGFI